MTDCCNNFGGRISIQIGEQRYQARGEITIMPSNLQRAAGVNQDGTAYFTSTPVLYEASMTFTAPCGIKWEEALNKCALNVTIVEEDNKRTHLFTSAALIGRPSVNLTTGEVTGLSIAASRYQMIEN